jgi:hypothetical protein
MAIVQTAGAFVDILALGFCWILTDGLIAVLTTTLILEPTIDGIRSEVVTNLLALMLATFALIHIQAARSVGSIENESVVAVALSWIGLAGKMSAQLIASAILSTALVGGWRLTWSARRSMLTGTTDLQLKVINKELIAGSRGIHANAKVRIASNGLG